MFRHSDSVCKAVEWLLNLSKTAAYPNGESSSLSFIEAVHQW